MTKPRIIFFQVKETSLKLTKISQTALAHFEKKESLLFLVANQSALEFVDALLWRFPEDNFLPHSTSPDELISITSSMQNINGACRIFNLTAGPLLFEHPVKIIYELEDLTSPEKQQLSQKRYRAYREAGYLIASP